MKKIFAAIAAMMTAGMMVAFAPNVAANETETGLAGNGRGEPHYYFEDGTYATNCVINILGRRVYFDDRGIQGSYKLLKSTKTGQHYYAGEDGFLAENEVVISQKGNVFVAGTDGILLNYLTETDFADVIEILDLQDGYYTETTPYYYIFETQDMMFYVDGDTNTIIGLTMLKDCLTGEELEAAGFKEEIEGKYVRGSMAVYVTEFGTAVMF